MFPGEAVISFDRFLAQVSAGHDERVRTAGFCRGKQQMLKRCIGEHNTELGKVVRDGRREREGVGGISLANSMPAQQHDGTNAAGQQAALGVVDMAQAFSIGKAAHHNGKRLITATLAAAKLGYRLLVGGVAGQVEPAQSLYGDDRSVGQQLDAAFDDGIAGLARGADGWCCVDRRWHNTAVRLEPRNMRSTIKTGIGLRVKPPIERVGILCGAGGAHGETIHRGSCSVIGQRANDGKARSAIGAVDKGIVKASVGGVEQFAQTVVARGDVGRDERRVGGLILRRHNAKALLAGGVPVAGCQVHKLDMLNAGRGRRVLRQRGDKAVECLDRSMRLDVHAITRIEHPAADAVRHSLAIHKWPHANTLHNARYMDMHMPHVALPRQNRPKVDRFIFGR